MKYYFFFAIFLLSSFSWLWGQTTEDKQLNKIKLKVERLPDLNIARSSHAVFYAGDELTVVGGHTSGFVPTPTAEYFSDGEWHTMSTVYAHDNGLMVSLKGGSRILIAGGNEKNLGIGQTYEAEMYYPETHTFEGFGCLDRKRALAEGVEIDSGRVLIVGNHRGNDAFEMYDGNKSFRHVKEVSVWRFLPYVLPMADGDAIVFGSVWRNNHSVPCDTVDRLKGVPFRVPLLEEWMPLCAEGHALAPSAFIGNKEARDYRYLIAASNHNDSIAFILIQDTCFSLLPTACPVPTSMNGRAIHYFSPAIADTNVRRAYIMGRDTAGCIYIVAVEYDKPAAPLTLYYTDPMPEFGNTTPVLTPEGNLIVVGGILDDNFSPFASAWLLHVGDSGCAVANASVSNGSMEGLWWVLLGLLVAGGTLVAVRYFRRRHATHSNPSEPAAATFEPDVAQAPQPEVGDNELMARIIHLIEDEKLYLKSDLQVSDVADALGVHRNTVSACINSQRGCNYSQLVNDYRLQHAKQLLSESPEMKISAVGLESGFANERSFYRSFKTATGLTPGEWVKMKRVKGS